MALVQICDALHRPGVVAVGIWLQRTLLQNLLDTTRHMSFSESPSGAEVCFASQDGGLLAVSHLLPGFGGSIVGMAIARWRGNPASQLLDRAGVERLPADQGSERAVMARPPNTRVQRTRSSASPPHSPLTRSPLGALNPRCLLIALMIAVLPSSRLRADKPLPPPARVTACSSDQAFCAIADPSGPSLSVFSRGGSVPIWSLPAWHRQFYLQMTATTSSSARGLKPALPLDTKLSDPLLVFMIRKAMVRVVAVGELFPDLSSLRRTASHLEWGKVVGISRRDQLIVELVGGRRVAYSMVTGRLEPEK